MDYKRPYPLRVMDFVSFSALEHFDELNGEHGKSGRDLLFYASMNADMDRMRGNGKTFRTENGNYAPAARLYNSKLP